MDPRQSFFTNPLHIHRYKTVTFTGFNGCRLMQKCRCGKRRIKIEKPVIVPGISYVDSKDEQHFLDTGEVREFKFDFDPVAHMEGIPHPVDAGPWPGHPRGKEYRLTIGGKTVVLQKIDVGPPFPPRD